MTGLDRESWNRSINFENVSGTRMRSRRVSKWVGLDCNQSACAMSGNIILQTSEVHVHNYVCAIPKLIDNNSDSNIKIYHNNGYATDHEWV